MIGTNEELILLRSNDVGLFQLTGDVTGDEDTEDDLDDVTEDARNVTEDDDEVTDDEVTKDEVTDDDLDDSESFKDEMVVVVIATTGAGVEGSE